MRVAVLEAKRVIYEGNAGEVVLPGEDGEFSVLDFHQDFLYCLKKGVVRITEKLPSSTAKEKNASRERSIKISHGLAKMMRNELIILA